MPALVIDAGLDDDERRRRLYSGDIFKFSPTQVGPSLVALAKGMLEEAFAPHKPCRGSDNPSSFLSRRPLVCVWQS